MLQRESKPMLQRESRPMLQRKSTPMFPRKRVGLCCRERESRPILQRKSRPYISHRQRVGLCCRERAGPSIASTRRHKAIRGNMLARSNEKPRPRFRNPGYSCHLTLCNLQSGAFFYLSHLS